jgi:hypothetical protein
MLKEHIFRTVVLKLETDRDGELVTASIDDDGDTKCRKFHTLFAAESWIADYMRATYYIQRDEFEYKESPKGVYQETVFVL